MTRRNAVAVVLSVVAILSFAPAVSSGTYMLTEIGTLPANSVVSSKGTAINSAGSITGWGQLDFGQHAFVYQSGVMTDIGTLGGAFSYGHGINSLGEVTGYSTVAGNSTS